MGSEMCIRDRPILKSAACLRVNELLVDAEEELADADERLSNSSSEINEFFLLGITF